MLSGSVHDFTPAYLSAQASFYAEELTGYSAVKSYHGEQVHCLLVTDIPVLLGPPHLLQGLLQEPPLVCKALAVPAALFQGLTQGIYFLLGRGREEGRREG